MNRKDPENVVKKMPELQPKTQVSRLIFLTTADACRDLWELDRWVKHFRNRGVIHSEKKMSTKSLKFKKINLSVFTNFEVIAYHSTDIWVLHTIEFSKNYAPLCNSTRIEFSHKGKYSPDGSVLSFSSPHFLPHFSRISSAFSTAFSPVLSLAFLPHFLPHFSNPDSLYQFGTRIIHQFSSF